VGERAFVMSGAGSGPGRGEDATPGGPVSYSVTIKNGLADIALPGGTIAQGGQTYTLTDDQYLALSPTAAAALFSNSSQTGGGGGSGAWSIDPTAYGAKGDGQISTTGSMTSGSAILTISENAFVEADEGKYVMVKGAGINGVTSFIAKISNFVDAQHVQLDTNAASTISGAQVLWGTDDTAAFQAAVNAAVAYGLMHSYTATVRIPAAQGRFYCIAGALVSGGATKGNAQITLPVIPTTGAKFTLAFEGPADGASVRHWEQQVPQTGGATLVSFFVHASTSAQITSINNGGNSAVIGGPAQPGGYGTSALAFSNMNAIFYNVSILTAHSSFGLTLTSLDLSGVANASLENFAYGTTATVADPSTDLVSPGTFSAGLSIGLLLPASGNNDLVLLRNVTCSGGYTYGIFATEHCDITSMRILYCWAAFCPVGNYYSSGGSSHSIRASLLSIEACTYELYVIGSGVGGLGPFLDLQIDTESGTPQFGDNNAGAGSAAARGRVVLTGLYTTANITLDHPVGYDIVDGQRSYPTISVSANYTVNPSDGAVLVDCTAAAHTVTLPTAVGRTRSILVAKTDASANAVTVAAQSGQTINGVASKTHSSQWSSGEYFPNGASGWFARLI
jgi:hypothetical protein